MKMIAVKYGNFLSRVSQLSVRELHDHDVRFTME